MGGSAQWEGDGSGRRGSTECGKVCRNGPDVSATVGTVSATQEVGTTVSGMEIELKY